MLDIFNLPPSQSTTPEGWTTYFSVPSVSTNDFFLWEKPRGCKMIFAIAISSGGGGGGGFTGAAGTARGGGGGGGCGAMSSLIIPARFIPDVLYAYVGPGGAGGTGSGVAGSAGNNSRILGYPVSANAGNIWLQAAGSTQAAGGQAGTSAGNQLGGAIAQVNNINNCVMASGGIITFTAVGTTAGNGGTISGANGSQGGTGGNANGSGIIQSGSGGGTVGTNNTDFAGGVNGNSSSLLGPMVVSVAASGAGSAGFNQFEPFLISCGGGGGGTGGAAGTLGGVGGPGGFGSGGGGGGGGTTGGAGGRGGDGLVVIVCW